MEYRWEEKKFQAALVGVDLEKEVSKRQGSTDAKRVSALFQDPKEYEKLSDEEKEKMTQEMIERHKLWARGNVKGLKTNE